MILDFDQCRLVSVVGDDGEITNMPPPAHVKAGIETIVNHPYFLLGDDMGGMKSAQAIISAQFLYQAGIIERVIVVAPAAVRPMVWYDPQLSELSTHLFVPSRIVEFHKNTRTREQGNPGPKHLTWILTNYEFLIRKRYKDLLPYCDSKTLLILDESSAVKNHKSARTEACMALRWVKWGQPRCGRILLLNGTPIAESPEDMFSQGNLMHPTILNCRFITHFRARYAVMEAVRGAGGRVLTDSRGNVIQNVSSWKNLTDLQDRFKPYVLRRLTRDCVDLPPLLPPVTLSVPLTTPTWASYGEMRDENLIWLEQNIAMARSAAIKVLRLAQITSGIIGGVRDASLEEETDTSLTESLGLTIEGLTLEGNICAPKFSGVTTQYIGREKIDFLHEWFAERLLEDPNLKLLVWSRFVPELRRFLTECRERYPNMAVGAVCGESIFGGRVSDERAMSMRLLHPQTTNVGPAVVGGTYGTGAMGLNFTAFHTVFNLSQVYEPWKRSQADKRVDRPGQRHSVATFDLVATGPRGQKTIDHAIVAARRGKHDLNTFTASAWIRLLRAELEELDIWF